MPRLALLILLALAGCSPAFGQTGGIGQTKTVRRVACLGDSITRGNQGFTYWPEAARARGLSWWVDMGNYGVAGESASGMWGFGRANYSVYSKGDSVFDAAVVYLGVNDLNGFGASNQAADIYADALEPMFEAIEASGVEVFPATVPPFKSCSCWSSAKETQRQALNTLIRASGRTVVDFDAATRDAVDPSALQAAFDTGITDGVHLTQAGENALADQFVATYCPAGVCP